MNRVSVALVVLGLVTSHLTAQGGYRNAYDLHDLHPVVARTIFSGRNPGVRQNLDGGVCFPAPFYENCIYDYNYYALDLHRLWAFYTIWNGVAENDPPQPTYPNKPPDPAPPVTLVVHEYNWPKEVNPPAPFSIVTTSGTEYLATMVWVQEGNVYFTSVDGGVCQLPLSSVSRSLTQTANAQKSLNLSLPWPQAPRASVAAAN